MRILSLDVGDRRIGLAISDPTGMLATPLKIITYTDIDAACREITGTAVERQADKIVVGLPLSMSGNESQQTIRTPQFCGLLAKNHRFTAGLLRRKAFLIFSCKQAQ